MMNISKYPYMNWKQLSLIQRSILVLDYGLIKNTSNAAKSVSYQSVRRFVKEIAENDGCSFLFRLRKCDGRSVSDGTIGEAVEVLPPRHTKRSLVTMYTESESSDA